MKKLVWNQHKFQHKSLGRDITFSEVDSTYRDQTANYFINYSESILDEAYQTKKQLPFSPINAKSFYFNINKIFYGAYKSMDCVQNIGM